MITIVAPLLRTIIPETGGGPCPDITIPDALDVRAGVIFGEDGLEVGLLTLDNYSDNPTPPSFTVETINLESSVQLVMNLESLLGNV